MRKSVLRRPSPALVVAFVALVVALGGTSYAAFSLPKNSVGSKQIKNGAVTNSKLKKGAVTTGKIKNGTVTKSKINTSGLTVPNALQANNAITAGSAINASNLSGLYRWHTTVASPGASIASPASVTLATIGPFTVIGECYLNGTNTDAGTFISTTQNGSAAQGYDSEGLTPFGPADGAIQISQDITAGTTATHVQAFNGPDDGSWAAQSGDSTVTLNGFGNQGVYMQGASGPACSFSGFALSQ